MSASVPGATHHRAILENPTKAKLPFVETFNTIQGEGPAAGQGSTFLRFGGCNLSCSWCDTPFTWDGQRFDLRAQIDNVSAFEVLDRIKTGPRNIVITGGEPLLNQSSPAWAMLLTGLRTRYRQLHLETNGTIAPNAITRDKFDLFVVSPKQAHAGSHRGRQNPTMHPDWVAVSGAILKIVVKDADGVAEAAAFAKAGGWMPQMVWVMPEGTTPQVLASRWREVADAAIEHGINASHRLHVLAWNDDRGH